MADLGETNKTRLYSPSEVFTGTFTHLCMAKCGNTMRVPNPNQEGAKRHIDDGDIWTCNRCGAKHEYYMVYRAGVRAAQVKLLKGLDIRSGAEPTIGEFVKK